jgi:hypothetical protein
MLILFCLAADCISVDCDDSGVVVLPGGFRKHGLDEAGASAIEETIVTIPESKQV